MPALLIEMSTFLWFLALWTVADDAAGSARQASARIQQREAFELPTDSVETVRAFLTSNWRLTRKADTLVVRREPKLRVQRKLPGSPARHAPQPDATMHVEHYEITLRCQPRVSPKQRAARARDLQERIDKLHQEMKAFQIARPTRSRLGRAAAQ